MTVGAHPDLDSINAVEVLEHSVLTTLLLLPGIGTVHDLKHAYEMSARWFRIAPRRTEAR